MELKMAKNVTANADTNIVDLFKVEEGNRNNPFYLKYLAIEAAAGTKMIINGNLIEVPLSGKFVTPFEGEFYLKIYSLYFPDGISSQNIYYII
jgi:hypothetical protein